MCCIGMVVQNLAIEQWYQNNYCTVPLDDDIFPMHNLQLDALNPASDILMRDLAGAKSHEQYTEVLRTAVEVS